MSTLHIVSLYYSQKMWFATFSMPKMHQRKLGISGYQYCKKNLNKKLYILGVEFIHSEIHVLHCLVIDIIVPQGRES